MQVRRFGSSVGIFPETEENIPDERCVAGTGTFMYRVHGRKLFLFQLEPTSAIVSFNAPVTELNTRRNNHWTIGPRKIIEFPEYIFQQRIKLKQMR